MRTTEHKILRTTAWSCRTDLHSEFLATNSCNKWMVINSYLSLTEQAKRKSLPDWQKKILNGKNSSVDIFLISLALTSVTKKPLRCEKEHKGAQGIKKNNLQLKREKRKLQMDRSYIGKSQCFIHICSSQVFIKYHSAVALKITDY